MLNWRRWRRSSLRDRLSGDDWVATHKIDPNAEIRRVFQRFVFESEDIEVDLVAFDEVLVGEALEAFGLGALVAVRGVVAGNKFVEVRTLQLVFLQGEVLVGPKIINPQLIGPCSFLRRLAVEEKHVRLHALCVEDAGG
jgi:hypothetical protein